MKRVFLMAAVIALVGCTKDPISTAGSDNPAVTIDKMFTHDGVTVYRFVDNGRAVYFSSPSSSLTYSHSEACGKGCTRSVTTQTLGL